MEPRIVRQAGVPRDRHGRAGSRPRRRRASRSCGSASSRGPIDTVPHRRGSHTLGVCIDADPATVEQAGFTLRRGGRGDVASTTCPPGMVALTVPASTYAVFTHTRAHLAPARHGEAGVGTLAAGVAVPSRRRRPDFELYDERWDPTTGNGEIDVYVPIAEPTA